MIAYDCEMLISTLTYTYMLAILQSVGFKKNMQNMKLQDPDMYQHGCDFITYSLGMDNI